MKNIIERKKLLGNGYCAAICYSIGIGSSELSEIAGVEQRHARRIMLGITPMSSEIEKALIEIHGDIEVMAFDLRNKKDIKIYKNTKELRLSGVKMKKRGKAKGGFIGPYCIAAWKASMSRGIPIVF